MKTVYKYISTVLGDTFIFCGTCCHRKFLMNSVFAELCTGFRLALIKSQELIAACFKLEFEHLTFGENIFLHYPTAKPIILCYFHIFPLRYLELV